MFVECALPSGDGGGTVDEFWTGTQIDAQPPSGWVKVKSFLDTSFQSIECASTAAASYSECAGRKCGDLCIVEGDMAGTCDAVGACSFHYDDIKCKNNPGSNDNEPVWHRMRTKVTDLFS